ncbi:hypothetical protein JQ634_11785 [Bradyrhizobium sp. AUGA SZCCT0240]|uniref:hypothetical protein n=1 Tax=unclassified Bradyrhizobium TaxID=2631580 RepID=UPI001BA7B646|nr:MULTISPECIES: hypothetical protein [unclassified Bradyrhizobium]MBR1190118.1 hypothetical protein [Bradyrhizobium sp. AUGA SZCCT0160]MBR1197754.1 hypothetical protein [Bradyrhizobium sp. AUGA SZCCT0158]MBR1240126.1 hypothetical protein [Bradyrhizobium sp. AUGA SZCCT0274]MBR1254387.1 hypothetical protein [Bradyrhizobium sp. AUGA SZCCT0240]
MMTPTPSRSTEIAGEPSGNLENGFQLGPFGVIDFHPIDGEKRERGPTDKESNRMADIGRWRADTIILQHGTSRTMA